MKLIALILVVLMNLTAVRTIRLAILPPPLSPNSWNLGLPNKLRFIDEVPRRIAREPRMNYNYPASFWFRG
ncbi:unnamed protein product [Cylicocyclus nassatus]|uniref:Uncharacterized protein n=1 Tax=Cylicocyclus nassatus TaxID=53992 RepID=A0AA36GIC7_CYLNA|nr:unnamed protein product [Cylicocyclus nassatus]